MPSIRREGLHGGRITTDPGRTVVCGSSFGGLTALFAVARTPTSSRQPWSSRRPSGATRRGLSSRRSSPRTGVTPFACGSSPGPRRGLVPAAEAVTAALLEGGIDASLEPRSGGHEWAWWLPGFVDGAADLLRRRRGRA